MNEASQPADAAEPSPNRPSMSPCIVATAYHWPRPGAVLELLKPITWFPPMWAYLCGFVSTGVSLEGKGVALLAGVLLAGPLVCATSQAVNDWFDRDVDAINQPERVIPSGRMPGYWGLYVGIAWSVLSLLVAASLGPVVLLAAVAVEWALTSWADRSTGDATTNSALRDRVGAQFEIPVLGLALAAVLALAVSRMFLWGTGNAAVLIAGVLSVVILAVAVLAVFRPQLGRRAISGIVGVVAVAIIALGVVSAVIEPRVGHHGDEHDADHSAESTVEGE